MSRRRTYALPWWEGTQILLGLTIPYLLLVHIVNTRGTRILTGIEINYPYEIANLWIDPWLRAKQILLVLLVWGHFVVGLHFWLRLHAWYRRAFPLILLAYVLIPIGALLGFAESGMKTTAKARSNPAWVKQMKVNAPTCGRFSRIGSGRARLAWSGSFSERPNCGIGSNDTTVSRSDFPKGFPSMRRSGRRSWK